MPVGLDIVAVVIGVVALKKLDADQRKARIRAHIGLWAGAAKLIIVALMFLWVIVAFMINPVAH